MKKLGFKPISCAREWLICSRVLLALPLRTKIPEHCFSALSFNCANRPEPGWADRRMP